MNSPPSGGARRKRQPAVKGICFNIQRYAIHDGPGIRTTVFLKGCPLSCAWCHNPEGVSATPEILLFPERCMACGDCERICPNPPPVGSSNRDESDRSECTACGSCADVCPTGARSLAGGTMTVAELLSVLERDRPFYEETNGGVTFSGGEPLMQGAFLLECLRECRLRGMHTAVDTCGMADRDLVLQVLEHADLFLYDLKLLDGPAHREHTGAPLEPILENLRAIDEAGADVIVRFPMIPDVTDARRNIEDLGSFVASLRSTRTVHVLPFHRTASDKYRRLGRKWSYEETEPALPETVEEVISLLGAFGVAASVGGWIHDGKSQASERAEHRG